MKKLPEYNVLAEVPSTRFEKFEDLLEKYNPDEIFLASSKLENVNVADLVHIAHTNHKKFHLVPNELALDLAAVEISSLQKMPLLTLLSTNLDGWEGLSKTLFDKIVSIVLFITMAPLMAIVALKIWWEDKSAPIIYRSIRIGRNGESFDCLKFRSMIAGADKEKKNLKQKNQNGALNLKKNINKQKNSFLKLC